MPARASLFLMHAIHWDRFSCCRNHAWSLAGELTITDLDSTRCPLGSMSRNIITSCSVWFFGRLWLRYLFFFFSFATNVHESVRLYVADHVCPSCVLVKQKDLSVRDELHPFRARCFLRTVYICVRGRTHRHTRYNRLNHKPVPFRDITFDGRTNRQEVWQQKCINHQFVRA